MAQATELTLADQARMVAGLRAALQASQPGAPVELIETQTPDLESVTETTEGKQDKTEQDVTRCLR